MGVGGYGKEMWCDLCDGTLCDAVVAEVLPDQGHGEFSVESLAASGVCFRGLLGALIAVVTGKCRQPVPGTNGVYRGCAFLASSATMAPLAMIKSIWEPGCLSLAPWWQVRPGVVA